MKKDRTALLGTPGELLKNAAVFLLMAFALVYAVVQILPSFTDRVTTETALTVSVHHETPTDGYFFRSERVLESPNGGTPVTSLADGERIGAGETVAYVYHHDAVAARREELERVERKIEVLDDSALGTDRYSVDLEVVDNAAETALSGLYADIALGSLENAAENGKDLLVGMSRHDRIVSGTDKADAERSALIERRNALQQEISDACDIVRSPSSGYYYASVDGYEALYTPDLPESMDAARFKELIASEPAEMSERCCGKLVDDFVWHVVCASTKEDAASLNVGDYYSLRFPSEADATLKLELRRIIRSPGDDTALLVFRGNTVPERFSFKRHQEACIQREEYKGLAVKKDAIRIVDGMKGVYILDGDIVRFRLVEALYEHDGYCIVDDTLPAKRYYKGTRQEVDDETYAAMSDEEKENVEVYLPLALYDAVIVSGRNLFAGKLLA